MNIAVLGTGSVGQALAGKISSLGYTVTMGTRDVAEARQRTQADAWGNPAVGTWLESHPEVHLKTFREAVEMGGELIVFAMNGHAALPCLASVGAGLLQGKVLLDISNPLDFSKGFPPTLFVSNTESLAEQIQKAYPGLKVVKSLNTMSNPVMVNPQSVPGDHTVFISGDDAAAKEAVAGLLKSFGWAARNIFDLGPLETARGTEMILPLWLRLFGKIQSPFFNFHINKA